MLPVVLVLLVASSVLAAPSVIVNTVPFNEVSRPVDNGSLVSTYTVDGPFELIDEGGNGIFILSLKETLKSISQLQDPSSSALVVIQVIALLGELATGVPGDSCAAANLINAYAAAAATGNYNNVQPALRQFISRLQQSIDAITQLNANNENLKYTSLSKATCSGSGRSYNFEGAWDTILSRAGPYQVSLMNELYCDANRLYRASDKRNNNIGALVTASALAPVLNIAQGALPQLASFLKAVGAGANASQPGAAAKAALAKGVSVFSY